MGGTIVAVPLLLSGMKKKESYKKVEEPLEKGWYDKTACLSIQELFQEESSRGWPL